MAKIKSYTAGPDSQAATEEKISSCLIHKGCVRTENAGATMVARHSYPFMRVCYATSTRAFKASNR